MYKTNDNFHTPDKSLTIWRYIDFTKFVDLLINNQLFFCRSDKFNDPFEGVLRPKDSKNEATRYMLSHQHLTKKFYFLNCWHINNYQSDAMWKIFLKTNNGIAIKSTIGDLITSLNNTKEDIYIGQVYYRDLEKITLDELMNEDENKICNGRGSVVNQFNYKRISFEHEKELRLIYIDYPIPHVLKNGIQREPLLYKRIDISVKEFIKEIVIAPFADDWFKTLVEEVVCKLNFTFSISKSDLYYLDDSVE